VLTSKNARDVPVPAADNCRTCHKPSGTRADCATCHRFHPPDFPARSPLRHPSTALLAELTAASHEVTR